MEAKAKKLPPIFPDLNGNRASFLGMICARLFGKKIVSEDDGHILTAYRWLGVLYAVKFFQ
jgi:hypothetical protein